MWTLAAETSTSAGSVALLKGNTLIAETSWQKENTHSERITFEAEKLLANASLDFSTIGQYAVGTGPGSFTGIRVAINFIRTLAFTFDKPVVAVNSLLLLAAPALAEGLEIFCMQSAFRNFVYCAHYQPGAPPKVVLEPSALTIDELENSIKHPVIVLGRGYSLFENAFSPDLRRMLKRDAPHSDLPLAGNFSYLSLDGGGNSQQLRWNAIKPLYIRASEAEEKLRQSVRK